MTTRRIRSDDAAAAAEIVRLVRERPNDLIDPFPLSAEVDVLVDMGARGKADAALPCVAVERDTVVGYGAVDFSPEMRRALLVGPVVHPAHRTKGHGRALLDELLAQARDARQRQLRTKVGGHNKAAQVLLRSSGFRSRDRHTCLRLVRPPRFPEIAMADIRLERVDERSAEAYFEFTRKHVSRQPGQTRALLKTDDYCAILAYKRNRPVGCVEVDLRSAPAATIEHLDARPSLLHKGLGNALLSEAVRVTFADDAMQSLDLLMAGTDRDRIDALVNHGFEVRHELVAYQLRL